MKILILSVIIIAFIIYFVKNRYGKNNKSQGITDVTKICENCGHPVQLDPYTGWYFHTDRNDNYDRYCKGGRGNKAVPTSGSKK